MSSELAINALAALGGAAAAVLVGVMRYASRRHQTLAVREDVLMRSMGDLIESLQCEVTNLRARIAAQEEQILVQASQIGELRRQLGIGGD